MYNRWFWNTAGPQVSFLEPKPKKWRGTITRCLFTYSEVSVVKPADHLEPSSNFIPMSKGLGLFYGHSLPPARLPQETKGSGGQQIPYIILGTERHSIRFKKGKIFIMFGLISPQAGLVMATNSQCGISTGPAFTDLLLKSKGWTVCERQCTLTLMRGNRWKPIQCIIGSQVFLLELKQTAEGVLGMAGVTEALAVHLSLSGVNICLVL